MQKIKIEYFTDPLCCWSWAMEPAWRRLRFEFGDALEWRYVMAGLIPDWKNYNDSHNSVSHPSQMGPLWKEAEGISGMPMNADLWANKPLVSSYPACIAVKTSELQSAEAAETYLRSVREAVMLEGRDVTQVDVLSDIALHISEQQPGLIDHEVFRKDLMDLKAKPDFKEDLDLLRQMCISRFPTMFFKKGDTGKIITGYRPYRVLYQVMRELAPETEPLSLTKPERVKEYEEYWGGCIDQEKTIINETPHPEKEYADSLA